MLWSQLDSHVSSAKVISGFNRWNQFIEAHINSMSKDEQVRLKETYGRYERFDQLSTLEKTLFENRFLEAEHLQETRLLLAMIYKDISSQYSFDEKAFFDYFKDGTSQSSARVARNCQDVYWAIMGDLFSSCLVNTEFSTEECFLSADTSATWAYVGCIYGQL